MIWLKKVIILLSVFILILSSAVFANQGLIISKDGFARILNNIGVAFYKEGKTNNAIILLQDSIKIKNDYSKASYNLGLIYFEQKNFDKAIKNFQKTVQVEQNNANAHFDLAVAQVERFRGKESSNELTSADLDDLKLAIENYNKAIELNPQIPNAQSNVDIVKSVLDYYENQN